MLACTDEDLVMMLNEELFVEHRISYRTFQRYKSRAAKQLAIPDADPLYLDLLTIIRKAYVRLRQQLIGAILKDKGGARRYMWVLERKFKEWNLRWVPPTEEYAEDPEEPIMEEGETRYPTMDGQYYNLNHPERPKDIAPVHHAVYQGYVVPNPDYDGEEDDNTRAIKEMWELRHEELVPPDELARRKQQWRDEHEQKRAEQKAREAAIAAEEAQLPPAGPSMPSGRKIDIDKARRRLLNKIKNRNTHFHDEEPDDDDAWDRVGED